VGDWHGLGNLLDPEASGKAMRGNLVQLDSANCAVWSDTDRVIGVVGLEDVVVVDTPDAVLVTTRARAQEVKAVVDALRAEGREDLL
jgi:mannose-1-phosphate guanylyltransferase